MELKPGYACPSGYKQTVVGVIPEDWSLLRLSEGIQLISGHHVLAKFCNTAGDGVAYITGPADFPNGTIQHTKYTTRPSTICSTNDILVTVKGSGAGSLVYSNGEYCISRQLMAIRVHEWCTQFIFYSLTRDTTVFGVAATGLIPGLSRDDILNKLVLLPPITAEQEAIAEALSDADALVESLEQLIAKKRQIKQGAMQQLLTGKTRLSGFSGGWEIKRLGDLGSTFGGLTGKTKDDFGHGSARYVTFMNIMTNVLIDSSSFKLVDVKLGEAQNKVAKGDLFFNGSSETPEEVGMCSVLSNDVGNVYLNSFCFGYRLRDAVYANGLYLAYYFRSLEGRELLKSLAQGATRYNLSKMALLKVPFTLPSYEEQTAIATVLSNMDAEIAVLEAKLAKARKLKQGMMQELLTGRIRLV